jgi:hypothetical protein
MRNFGIALSLIAGFGLMAGSAWSADPSDYSVLGSDRGRVSLVGKDGNVQWSFPLAADVHDLTLLPSGNILLITSRNTVEERTKEGKSVWKYTAKNREGYKGPIEIHATERLANGDTMVAESGNKRIVEVRPDGSISREIPLTIDNPHPHRDTRLVRRTPKGTYLVCHEGDGMVREYDLEGKVIWSHKIDLAGRPRSNGHGPEGHGTEVYGAWRLKNGNTIIGAGNGNRVYEVDSDGKTVWSVDQKELPGITFAWITMVEILPNGNLIIGNCHAGESNPQLIEINRDKKVLWTFKDFKTFGNGLAATQVLGVPEGTVR